MNLKEFMKIPGEVSADELTAMIPWIGTKKDSVNVELGSLYGRTSAFLSTQTYGKVYSVENFCVNESDTEPYFKNKILPIYENIILLEGSTNKIAHEFFKPIDFLFIDADHQDHSIFEDCKFWLPKVKKGGVVAFHDYNNALFPAVARRVEERTKNWKILDQVDTLMIKEKNES